MTPIPWTRHILLSKEPRDEGVHFVVCDRMACDLGIRSGAETRLAAVSWAGRVGRGPRVGAAADRVRDREKSAVESSGTVRRLVADCRRRPAGAHGVRRR